MHKVITNMYLNEDEKKQADEYVLDIKNTIYSNLFTLLGLFVATFYIQIFINMLNTFTLPEMRIIAIFVFAWSTMKVMIPISQNINFEYKKRN